MPSRVAATAWPAAALPGKVLRRCRLVAVAPGVADPHKGGCVGPRVLRSCTTPDSPCPARANQRSPDLEGALRCRPGPLRAPPTRADHAVPPGAATRCDFLTGRRRCRRRSAAVCQRRVRRLPGARHPGARVLAPALRRLRPRQAGRVQLQAPGGLPVIRCPARGPDGRAPCGPCVSPTTRALVANWLPGTWRSWMSGYAASQSFAFGSQCGKPAASLAECGAWVPADLVTT